MRYQRFPQAADDGERGLRSSPLWERRPKWRQGAETAEPQGPLGAVRLARKETANDRRDASLTKFDLLQRRDDIVLSALLELDVDLLADGNSVEEFPIVDFEGHRH